MRSFGLGLLALIAAYVYWQITSLRRNIALAKRTGLPCIVSPCSPWSIPWQLTHKLWIPIIKLFPQAWWDPWLDPLLPDFSYHVGMKHFAKYGDIFVMAFPSGILVYTANAESIRQITARRERFPKVTDTYEILNQFGRNVISTEGAEWRMHRKATSPSFNERNAALVFRQSIAQAQGMLDHWATKVGKTKTKGEAEGETETETLLTLEHDTMRFALNIIGYVGFGLKLPWPHEETTGGFHPLYGSIKPPPGFHYSFVDTMAQLLDNVLMLLLVPKWLLRLVPLARAKVAVDSRVDYERYMEQLLEEKIGEARRGESPEEGMDLIGQLVRSSYELDETAAGKTSKTTPKSTTTGQGARARADPAVNGSGRAVTLTREEITGNAFVMLVAGHETTANALHFCLLHLAANPSSQRRLQADVDRLVGSTDPRTWEYETLVNPIMASMLGACMNETMRVIPSVIEVPKTATPDQDQVITLDGRSCVIPAGTKIAISAAAVHMNPRHWPARPSRIDPERDDVPDFVPERWFRSASEQDGYTSSSSSSSSSDESEDYGGFRGRDTSKQLFRPERGAYIPFSDGPRACLGRRIAQVELLAALAVLFQTHSVELAVDDEVPGGSAQLAGMDRGAQWDVYQRAADRCRATVAGASSLLTLKLHGKHVPVRVVKRGRERFVNWIDEAARPE